MGTNSFASPQFRPYFLAQPASTTNLSGTLASFLRTGVTAARQPLSYQWKKGSTAIPGATDSLLLVHLPVPLADNNTSYSVIVSNSAGSTNSAMATP